MTSSSLMICIYGKGIGGLYDLFTTNKLITGSPFSYQTTTHI